MPFEVGAALGAIPDVWDKIAGLRLAWINRNGMVYAYDYEIRLNLDLLGAVKKDALAGTAAGQPAFVELFRRLDP
jgi:hypothetical protein